MTAPTPTWQSVEPRLQAANVPALAMRSFQRHFQQLLEGSDNFIRESEIEPVAALPNLQQLPAELEQLGRAMLPHTVVLKLNGGLGTGMGLAGPKSLLPVRGGRTFLDFLIAQTTTLQVPLLLMNSFATHAATMAALAEFPADQQQRVECFLQHRVPKLRADDLSPVAWEPQPELAWCPPGHGDLYAALQTSGTLERLLEAGTRYLFVSNADNLGATLDLRILGYISQNEHGFLMEVADRTAADSKGGHLARSRQGTLLLRESAQCHADDMTQFQQIEKHRYFNTNNLWIDLPQLAAALREHEGILPLSMIVNRKTVDPVDPTSPQVVQLETAMGAAISCLRSAAALRVQRSRFAPVKTTGDLLAVRSDAYEVDQGHAVRLIPEREGVPPLVTLDGQHYKTMAGLNQFVPTAPSLRFCSSLRVQGAVHLHNQVQCEGDVELINTSDQPRPLPPGRYRGRIEL